MPDNTGAVSKQFHQIALFLYLQVQGFTRLTVSELDTIQKKTHLDAVDGATAIARFESVDHMVGHRNGNDKRILGRIDIQIGRW